MAGSNNEVDILNESYAKDEDNESLKAELDDLLSQQSGKDGEVNHE